MPGQERCSEVGDVRGHKGPHGKRKVVEFDGLLGAYELADRVCGAFGCPHHEDLTIPQEVA